MDRAEDDPLDEKMVESRRATYADWWPHENKKGWKCKTKKVAGIHSTLGDSSLSDR